MGGCFLGQKSSRGDYKIDVDSKITLLFGIKPGSQPIFIRPAILQIVAVLMILIGGIILWSFPDAFSTKAIVFKFMV